MGGSAGDDSGVFGDSAVNPDLYGQDGRQSGLIRVAGRQMELITLDQLYSLGFTYKQIRRRVTSGWLHYEHHNVLSVGVPKLAPKGHLLAAQLSLGDTSFLSHRSAAGVHGLRPINTHDIELTVTGSGLRKRPGLTIHRTAADPHPSEIRQHGPLRVSSVGRMLVELAATESEQELQRLITEAVRRKLLRLEQNDGRSALEEVLARHTRRPGMAKLKRALVAYRKPQSAASNLEEAFDALLRKHPEIPQPVRNVHIGPWEVDRFWPAHKLAVELDGRQYHVAAADMERDRLKDDDLQRRGLITLRITDFRFAHDQRGVLSALHHWLEVRRAG